MGVVVGGGGLTLEVETESLKNFEEESNNVGLDTGLLAVTGMNTGGEGLRWVRIKGLVRWVRKKGRT